MDIFFPLANFLLLRQPKIMLVLLIIFAYTFGMVLSLVGLPPMVGFLLSGFAYNFFGYPVPAGLEQIADLGITLLLFSIGLKLDLKSLAKPEIWFGSVIHIVLSTLFYFGILFALKKYSTNSLFATSDITLVILAFAFSFSSTVFAVKVLEERGNMYAFFGKVAIGILIMQDIFAVLYLSISEGKVPGIAALGVFALPLIRPLLFKLLDLAGHGEMLVLSSLFLALGVGAGGFSLMGLKADLGALVIGIMIGKHAKASELAKAFFSFKELLLVAFFVSIGLKGNPSFSIFSVAVFLCLLLPFKTSFYFLVLSRFGLRTRSNLLASLSLANYSEFGLIVAALGSAQGILPKEWLLVIALSVSISFIFAAPLNLFSEKIYAYSKKILWHLQTKRIHDEDKHIELAGSRILILGMGRIGMGVYKELKSLSKTNLIGIEQDPARIKKLEKEGFQVLLGDAGDSDFWIRLKYLESLETIFLALPVHKINVYAAQQVKKLGLTCKLAGIAKFSEEVEELSEIGVTAFNMYGEAGAGLVSHYLKEHKEIL